MWCSEGGVSSVQGPATQAALRTPSREGTVGSPSFRSGVLSRDWLSVPHGSHLGSAGRNIEAAATRARKQERSHRPDVGQQSAPDHPPATQRIIPRNLHQPRGSLHEPDTLLTTVNNKRTGLTSSSSYAWNGPLALAISRSTPSKPQGSPLHCHQESALRSAAGVASVLIS